MKIVAFLPAKGSSERIKSKNLKLLNGKPLFLHTLEKLMKCEFIDEVYLDSESDEILNYARYLNYIPLERAENLASNSTDGHQMFYNEVRQVEADIYIQILGTSPFIMKETIKRGIDTLLAHPEYDSVVLTKKEKQYTWSNGTPNYDVTHIPNSKELQDTVIETMGLYIVRSNAAHKLKRRIGNSPYLLEASAIESVDVNYPDDFELAEMIAKGLRRKSVEKMRIMAQHLSSCLISDILWDYGIESTITGLNLNLDGKKVMGYANTLKIRKLGEGEDFRGIYKGLDTYPKVVDGDIIIVSNECKDRAYFGELNCNLAIRSGAIATIIDGVTRDAKAVEKLDYPVFSRGYCCADVRGVATIESHNQKIEINGVTIEPGNLIFADVDGIVVVPRRLEQEVLRRAIKSMKTENTVIGRILDYEGAYSIYEKEGAF